MTIYSDENVYGSGLNEKDWLALLKVMQPFIHARDPSSIELSIPPVHLADHPLIQAIRLYKDTGEKTFLDQAGNYLFPTKESFGWYLAITK